MWRFPFKAMLMSLATPLVALPLLLGLFYEPVSGWFFLLWIALALIFEWRRFIEVVEEYMSEMRSELFVHRTQH